MAFGSGGMFIISLSAASAARLASAVTGLGEVYDSFGRFMLQAISFLLTFTIFLLTYKFITNTKTYWRYIWSGALVAAILFEIAKTVFIVYFDSFADFESVYGSLAPVLGLLLWAYVSSLILIFGAELAAEFGRLIMGVDRGMLIQPTKYSLRKDDERRTHYEFEDELKDKKESKVGENSARRLHSGHSSDCQECRLVSRSIRHTVDRPVRTRWHSRHA